MQKKSITNLWELLRSPFVEDFLTVNGFLPHGSAYDRFCKLCKCMERYPNAPIVKVLRESYASMLPNEFPLELRFCKEIWKRTSECFLLGEIDKNSFHSEPMIQEEILPPSASDFSNHNVFLLNGLQIPSNTWKDWKAAATKTVQEQILHGKILGVLFPRDFQFRKPNLYAVECYLKGESADDCLWLSLRRPPVTKPLSTKQM